MTNYYYDRAKFIESLKRAAKAEFRISRVGSHTHYLDSMAKHTQFHRWDQLQRNIVDCLEFDRWSDLCNRIKRGIPFALPHSAKSFVIADIKRYALGNFERCSVFSAPNKSTENGYSHPSIDLRSEVEASHGGIYPQGLIDAALVELEQLGPWCRDDDDVMFEYDFSCERSW